jgi:tetratricopeptide (TPR) repeat protein
LAVAHLARAELYRRNGASTECVRDCTRALAADPDSCVAHWIRALAWFAGGDYRRAIGDCSQALALGAEGGQVYRLRGQAYQRLGDHARAVADFEEAGRLGEPGAEADRAKSIPEREGTARPLEKEVPEWKVHCARGDLHGRRGEWAGAIREYDQAVALTGNAAQEEAVRARRALAHCQAGQYAEGVDDVSWLIDRHPQDGTGYRVRAEAHYRKGDLAAALTDCREAVRLNPEDYDAYLLAAEISWLRGRPHEAISCCRAAVRLDRERIEALRLQAHILLLKGPPDAAAEHAGALIRLHPGDWFGHYARGEARRLQGDYAGAVADLTEAIARNADPVAWSARAQAYLATREYTRAAADLLRATEAGREPDRTRETVRLPPTGG